MIMIDKLLNYTRVDQRDIYVFARDSTFIKTNRLSQQLHSNYLQRSNKNVNRSSIN